MQSVTPLMHLSPHRLMLLTSLYDSTFASLRLETSVRRYLERNYFLFGDMRDKSQKFASEHKTTVYSAGFYAIWSDQVIVWCTVNPDFDANQDISDTNPMLWFSILGQITYRGQYALSEDGRCLAIARGASSHSLGQLAVFIDGKIVLKAEIPAGITVIHQITSSFPRQSEEQKKTKWLHREQYANGVGYICCSVITDATTRIHRMFRFGAICSVMPLPFPVDDQVFSFAIDAVCLNTWVLKKTTKSTTLNAWKNPASSPTARNDPVALFDVYRYDCNGVLHYFEKNIVPCPLLLRVGTHGEFIVLGMSTCASSPLSPASSDSVQKTDFSSADYSIAVFKREGKLLCHEFLSRQNEITVTGLQIFASDLAVYVFGRCLQRSTTTQYSENKYDQICNQVIGTILPAVDKCHASFVYCEEQSKGWFVPRCQSGSMVFVTIKDSWDIPWTEQVLEHPDDKELQSLRAAKEAATTYFSRIVTEETSIQLGPVDIPVIESAKVEQQAESLTQPNSPQEENISVTTGSHDVADPVVAPEEQPPVDSSNTNEIESIAAK